MNLFTYLYKFSIHFVYNNRWWVSAWNSYLSFKFLSKILNLKFESHWFLPLTHFHPIIYFQNLQSCLIVFRFRLRTGFSQQRLVLTCSEGTLHFHLFRQFWLRYNSLLCSSCFLDPNSWIEIRLSRNLSKGRSKLALWKFTRLWEERKNHSSEFDQTDHRRIKLQKFLENHKTMKENIFEKNFKI